MSDDEAIEATSHVPHVSSSSNQLDTHVSGAQVSVAGPSVVAGDNLGPEDVLDSLMDISMEIASNKRMKKDHLTPFRLTFRDKNLEEKVTKSTSSSFFFQ